MKLAHLKEIYAFVESDPKWLDGNPDLEDASTSLGKFIDKMEKQIDDAIDHQTKRLQRLTSRDVDIEEYI